MTSKAPESKNACVANCACLNVYLHNKIGSAFNYLLLKEKLIKNVATGKKKKFYTILQKLVFFKLDIDLIPTLLECMPFDFFFFDLFFVIQILFMSACIIEILP